MFALAAFLLTETSRSFSATMPGAAIVPLVQSSNIGVNGFFATDKAQRGRTVQAAVVLDIPQGYHVNGNRPLGKYAIPTTVQIDAPRGVRTSAVTFPRAVVRTLKFSQGERLAVFEGRAVMRFQITLPSDFQQGVTELRAKVRFQACTDEVCYPPTTREVRMPIGVVGANDPVQRINTRIFGGGRRR
jgi:DsbC/DsbD-like thiol-disulfide interchange protein